MGEEENFFEEEVFLLHTVIQPIPISAHQIFQMIHLVAVLQAKALFCVDELRLHLQHFDYIDGAFQIFVLRHRPCGMVPSR